MLDRRHIYIMVMKMKKISQRKLISLIALLLFVFNTILFPKAAAFAEDDYLDPTLDTTPRIEIWVNAAPNEVIQTGGEYEVSVYGYNMESINRGYIYLQSSGIQNEAIVEDSVTSLNSIKNTTVTSQPISVLSITNLAIDVEFNEELTIDATGKKLLSFKVKRLTEGTIGVSLTDSNKKGIYFSKPGDTHSKKKSSYSGTTGTLTVSDLIFTKDSLPDGPYDVWNSDWNSFRNNISNNAITDASLPKAGEAKLKWQIKDSNIGKPSPPVIVGNYVYALGSGALVRINKENGQINKTTSIGSLAGFNTVSPAYGVIGADDNKKGVVFVEYLGGVAAFEATTLNKVWSVKLAGQNQTPIVYDSEKQLVYAGFWKGEEAEQQYHCIDANTGGIKWSLTNKGGFYWAGAAIVGDYLVVGGDDGCGEDDQSPTGKLYVVNKTTGELADVYEQVKGDLRCSITYDETSGKIYFTTKGGCLYSANISSEGKISDLQHKIYIEGAQSTSTPVVYKGRVYFGYGGGFNNNKDFQSFMVVDADTLEEIYRVSMYGYPQSSALLTTAYESTEDGTVYLYISYNYPPGGITVIKDKPGQTEPDREELFAPGTGHTQYCLGSPVCDSEGNLYYVNDSSTLFCLTKASDELIQARNAAKAELTAAYDPDEYDDENADKVQDQLEHTKRDINSADSTDDVTAIKNAADETLSAIPTSPGRILQKSIQEMLDKEEGIAITDETAITALRTTYDSLSSDEKAKVDEIKLELLETRLAVAKAETRASDAEAAASSSSSAIKEKDAKIEELNKKISDATKALEQAQVKLKEVTDKATIDAAALEKAKADLVAAEAALRKAQEEADQYKTDKKQADDELAAMKEALQKAQEELSTAKAELEELTIRSAKVAGIKATAGKKRVALKWKKLGDGYKYVVYQSTKKSKGFKKVKTVSSAKVTIRKLKKSKTYYYKVRAYKEISGAKIYTGYSKTVKAKIR